MLELKNEKVTEKYIPLGALDLPMLIGVVRNKLKFLTISFILILTSLFIYVFSLPSIYQSEVKVIPSQSTNTDSLSGISSQLGGIASIAGFALGNPEINSVDIALEVLKSKKFLIEFINKNNLKPVLMASMFFDEKSDELILNNKMFDGNAWLNNSNGETLEPSDLATYDRFVSENLTILRDPKSRVISIVISHFSPVVTQKISTELIDKINAEMKNSDIKDAKLAIEYLKTELELTKVEDSKKIFFSLIESQYQKLMIAKAKPEYVFKVLDPAMRPEEPIKPKRIILLIVSFFVAFILSIVLTFFHYLILKR